MGKSRRLSLQGRAKKETEITTTAATAAATATTTRKFTIRKLFEKCAPCWPFNTFLWPVERWLCAHVRCRDHLCQIFQLI